MRCFLLTLETKYNETKKSLLNVQTFKEIYLNRFKDSIDIFYIEIFTFSDRNT